MEAEVRLTKWRRSLVALILLLALAAEAASVPATRSVTLMWASDARSELAGYNVYYGTQSGNYTRVMVAGADANVTITGLVPGATYYFVVTAQSPLGLESDPSNEIAYQVPAPPD